TKASVSAFLNSIEDEQKRKDGKRLAKLMQEWTGMKPAMWGNAMIGYGKYHYKSERSRQEGDWPLTAFAPRKQNITVYIMPGFRNCTGLLKKLGKHTTGASCLYLRKLDDIDLEVLRELVTKSFEYMKNTYASQ